MTVASTDVDDLPRPDKNTTTVAMDFGRITLEEGPGALHVRHPRTTPVLVHVGD